MRSLRAALLCTATQAAYARPAHTAPPPEVAGSAAVSSRRLSATADWSQRHGGCSAASADHIMLLYSYPILVGQRYGRCSAASAYCQLRPHSYSTTAECPNRPGISRPVVRRTPRVTSKRRSSSTCMPPPSRAEQSKEQRGSCGLTNDRIDGQERATPDGMHEGVCLSGVFFCS